MFSHGFASGEGLEREGSLGKGFREDRTKHKSSYKNEIEEI